ncbi:flagellar basal body P-ring protein FlgI [candidate division KSB1 bacterium]|nr:flagellar basal body P-ring protein FlgI [candidate division KSB1 bacterium]
MTRLIVLVILIATPALSQVRIRDITTYPNSAPTTLTGYGLVVGLAGSGDGSKSTFTPQSFATMLKEFGIVVDPATLKLKNVAAVMVTCEMAQGTKFGSRADALVSSLGDATSLQGGTLLRTVMQDPWGEPVAEAQGPISIGGFNFESQGSRVSKNHSVVGRIPQGIVMLANAEALPAPADTFVLSLTRPDVQLAVRVATAINNLYPERARVLDPSTIVVELPHEYVSSTDRLSFQSELLDLTVRPVASDRIVINERTGTIVVGAAVVLLPAAIAHGNLTVEITERSAVSQPPAFSNGQTISERQSRISVENAGTGLLEMEGAASVGDVARALNALGVSPRDMIAIFQGLKESGSLQAELVII